MELQTACRTWPQPVSLSSFERNGVSVDRICVGPRYVNIGRDTPLILPPNLRDWVAADHLVHFIDERGNHSD